MAVNRPQASELLNLSEMRLFDDSRPGALRAMTRAALAARVARARAARDRARDLLKRQKLAARARGDVAGGRTETAIRTARKEALLVDILQRFVEARREAPTVTATKKTAASKAAKPAVAKAPGTTTARKATTAKKATTVKKAITVKKSATAKKAVTVKPAVAKPAVKKTTGGKADARGTGNAVATADKRAGANGAAARMANPTASKAATGVTPRKALANTRKLLAAKQRRDREAQPWQSLDPTTSHVPDAGYQSPEAKAKAVELHAAESRMASNHGSMGARDRHAQGRRDHRGDTD
ncbi:hypothetical protein [Luteimonas sp. MC1572]|uniref:hypothetical protein n=1 Tax=Luteimonas sp. MC1572 TaxID=2799325 RepID=UPI0018F1072F|nr:hypothetical protein [Luteimonas sp. MC1572]MBJ6982938.1 hypothetical protein [Luteimonas sp. MC1572]QQO04158.1 hypothetical protein JGR64_05250 [Luteimonas sp. MC1572]